MAGGSGWVPAVGSGAAVAASSGMAVAVHGARVRQGGSAAWRPLALGGGHGAAGLAAALRGWAAGLALPERWRCRGAAGADSAGAAQPRAGHGAGGPGRGGGAVPGAHR